MSSLAQIHGDRVPGEATRRRLTDRQAATVQRLADALVGELAEAGYEHLTVRNVARRAGVAPATAYTYFTSKAHLVSEVFWRRLLALPDTPADPGVPPAERVVAVVRDIAQLVAGDPGLAAACSPALLGAEADVAVLRDRIGAELHRRLARALAGGEPGEDATDDDVVTALDLMLTGALLQAGMGHMPYAELGNRLAGLVPLVVGGRS